MFEINIEKFKESMISILKEIEHTDTHCITRLLNIIDKTFIGAKSYRFYTFLNTLKELGHTIDDNSKVVGFCIEVLQTALIISDDIIDNSEIRRGHPCWYKLVGLNAHKDAIFLLLLIKKILKKYSLNSKSYTNLLKVYENVLLKTILGELHDVLPSQCTDFESIKKVYSIQNYKTMVIAKTAYYTIYLPIYMAYIYSDKVPPKNLLPFSEIMGIFMQFKDDYLNFFPEKTKKTSNDLQECKLTWYLSHLVEESKNENDKILILQYFQTKGENIVLPFIKKRLELFEEESEVFLSQARRYLDEETRKIYKFCIELYENK
ncbi:farnesyl pyrophosphate synthetase [Hamiltosporidium tvaerminnensis]|uniref:Farnesyl pyrophosphate synthetase n=2 Tax=Hamiltosporidium tvaerminnensis TaxID=1176355 RepID=A0A4Q9L7D9_9MICR|nr:hypothetical protein LUQ84_002541 [Hamiltosporidium tvaerminnensis]TBU03558.1 farnesyl pyrophosphate synthetase [Hamiltosporidium tvaerminnensis]